MNLSTKIGNGALCPSLLAFFRGGTRGLCRVLSLSLCVDPSFFPHSRLNSTESPRVAFVLVRMHRIKHMPRPFGPIVFSRWCYTKFLGERSYGEARSIGSIPKRFSVSDEVEGKKAMDHSTVGFSMSRRSWWEKAPEMENGISLLRQARNVQSLASRRTSNCFGTQEDSWMVPSFARTFASNSNSQSSRVSTEKEKKDISTVQDPFEDLTYNIPEKPVTFTEGASYSLVILAGLGIAGAAGYAVCKELIFEPKEYKIFGKALERVQNDSQVRVRIGSPITGYGNESRNRAARQRIPNRSWTDEDGVERVEVNFYIRGPHGAGKVYTEMFKDKTDKNWKFTYLIVEITSPSRVQLMLESYVPA